MTPGCTASPLLHRLAMGWRVVIDSNLIEASALITFLASDPRNRVVVPVEIWFELYKQGNADALRRGLEIVAKHLDQVWQLHATGKIMRFDPSIPDMAGRMVMPNSGEAVGAMFKVLSSGEPIDPVFAEQLTAGWATAAEQNLGMLEGAAEIVEGLPMMQKDIFSEHELRVIRKSERFSRAMFGKIFGAAEQINEALSALMGLPLKDDHRIRAQSLQFRISLGIMIHHLWWVRKGSQSKKKLEATRNDMIDLLLAAQATYFDDFMTQDEKAGWIYQNLNGALGLFVRSEFV